MSFASLVDRWKRRGWRADTDALARLSGTERATVITGGSDGIGKALAHAFASTSATLVLVARNPDRLLQAADDLRRRGVTIPIETLALDITTPDAAAVLKTFLAGRNLHADILINAAGIANTGPFAETSADALEAEIRLNITALTNLTRALLPDMLVRGRGGVLNIASLGGLSPGPYQAVYYASKAYVISLTRALAEETRGQGVRITVSAPGPVNTAFHARAKGETSLYRVILPALSAEKVAAASLTGYQLGHDLVIPGILYKVLGFFSAVLPDDLLTLITGILLKPRAALRDRRARTAPPS